MAKNEKTSSQPKEGEIQKVISSSNHVRNRMSVLSDELHILKKELNDFKKQVTVDLNQVVDGLQAIAKQKK